MGGVLELLKSWLWSDPLKRIKRLGMLLALVLPIPAVIEALRMMGVRVKQSWRRWMTFVAALVCLVIVLCIVLLAVGSCVRAADWS